MEKSKSDFALTQLIYKDEAMVGLARETNQKTLAAWAVECTERVLPFFEGNILRTHALGERSRHSKNG